MSDSKTQSSSNLQDASLQVQYPNLQSELQSSTETAETPSRLGRRFFLGAGAGVAGAAAAALVQPPSADASILQKLKNRRQRPTVSRDSACDPATTVGTVENNSTACSSDPPVYRLVEFNPTCIAASQGGEVNLPNLSVELDQFTYQCGASTTKQVTGRMFNGVLPGPSMVLDPGDRIRLTITNNLPLDSNGTGDGQCPGTLDHPNCFNTFNMHFHGLHVSPTSYCDPPGSTTQADLKVLSSDDVLYQIPSSDPPKSHEWCVWLPDFHAPGTHWYHAHRHGSTGLQVSNGMAGAIIVREPTATQIVPPNNDKIWVVQEIILPKSNATTQLEQDLAVYTGSGGGFGVGGGGSPGDFLVNGRFQPTITLQAKQNQRWRFINANSTPRGFINLKLRKINSNPNTPPNSADDLDPTKGDLAPLWLIAVDGISFYDKPPTLIGCDPSTTPPTIGCDGWTFAAGNRSDFLVNLDPGWYKVVKELSPPNQTGPGQPTAPQVIAYVKVDTTTATPQTIPAKVPGIALESPDNPYKRYLRPISDAEVTDPDGKIEERLIEFSTQPPAGPAKYFINKGINGTDGLYEPNFSDVTVDIGSVEQWSLKTTGGAGHPFHIHVNPFQIVGDLIDPSGDNVPSNWRFWDTIALPNGAPPTKIRSRFVDYTGTYVFHCHILIHEDQGMMKNVTVQDKTEVDWQTMPASGTLPAGVGAPPCASLNAAGEYQLSQEAQDILADGGKVCEVAPPANPATVETQKVDPDPDPPTRTCSSATCP